MALFSTAARRIAQTARQMAPVEFPAVYIVSATRTPIGSFNGVLKKVPATELGVTAVKGAIERAGLKPEDIEDVYYGNVIQASVGQSPARQVAIGAGCPETTEATTINKVCASGMKAISLAAQNIQTGQRSIMVAGGMESMSNAPFYVARQNPGYGHGQLTDSLVRDGLFDVYNKFPMGNCAEKTAKDHSLSREDQDAYAIESYKRSAEAWKAGAFKNEIVPVVIADKKGSVTVEEDEEYKNVKLDKIPTLRPVFDPKGTVTAANASTINDGASAVVLVGESELQKRGLKPLAKIICSYICLRTFRIRSCADAHPLLFIDIQPSRTLLVLRLTSPLRRLRRSPSRWSALASPRTTLPCGRSTRHSQPSRSRTTRSSDLTRLRSTRSVAVSAWVTPSAALAAASW